MSQKPQNLSFPFVTRDMLSFEEGATFRLHLQAKTNSTGTIQITGATREGIFAFNFIPAGLATLQEAFFNIPDAPLWITVSNLTQDASEGQIYVAVDLQINQSLLYTLCSGYVYWGHEISWPTSNLATSVDHKGQLTVITTSDPAANTEISQTVPVNYYWKIKSVRFQLVTDGNAATRQVHLQITDGTNILMDIIANGTQTASLTRNYSFVPVGTVGTKTANLEIVTEFPNDLLLPQGFKIVTVTDSIQATDNYGVARIYVERFLTQSP